MSDGKKVGDATHYYTNLGVATVKLTDSVKSGDTLRFLGSTTNFDQVASSMQYDHTKIEEGKKGQEIGIKVDEKVRKGDEVYLIS